MKYETFEKITRKEADRMRLDFDIKTKEKETIQLIKEERDNEPLVKFEEFKNWVKENGFALSGIIIGIGGID